ncbi:hypothetical protein GQ607_000786 [Colletotrichum asianum]|uniref:Uncharacterized protein n=1 Tax=Colletotrichum asianum TaxID=702518 RepID=A0A8H3WN54_9PEZI|nr:hypothetical protein GQ607_000786 [Colletotrichum asianum]
MCFLSFTDTNVPNCRRTFISLLIIDSNNGGAFCKRRRRYLVTFSWIQGALSGMPYDSRLEGTSSTLDGL